MSTQYNLLDGVKYIEEQDEAVRGEMKRNVYQIKDDMLHEGMEILDIGANVGLFSLYMVDRIKAKGIEDYNILAFEADPANHEVLKKNVDGLAIHPLHYAVWSIETEIEFEHNHINRGAGAIGQKSGTSVTVKTFPINRLGEMKDKDGNARIWDIVKVDIEGAEYEVLNNASDTFFENVKYFTIEFHSLGGVEDEKRFIELINKLSRNGFCVNVVGVPIRGGYIYARNINRKD